MNTIREVEKINEQELERGIAGTPASWHSQYRNSPWVYVGNLDHQLTEGDVLCVMSQFGEIEDINLARDEDTGKSRGFAFVKYEDARSCILAVDNLVGIKLCGRSLRVDHMEKYRLPKKLLEQEEAKKEKQQQHFGAGHAYKDAELANQYSMHQGQDLFAPPTPEENPDDHYRLDKKRRKEEKKQRKEEDKLERRRKREERRNQKEEERRRHRADRYRHQDYSSDEDKDNSNSRDEDRRKHRTKRKHPRRESHDYSGDEESGEDRKRRRKSHKRSSHRDRHDSEDDSRSRRDRRRRERR